MQELKGNSEQWLQEVNSILYYLSNVEATRNKELTEPVEVIVKDGEFRFKGDEKQEVLIVHKP